MLCVRAVKVNGKSENSTMLYMRSAFICEMNFVEHSYVRQSTKKAEIKRIVYSYEGEFSEYEMYKLFACTHTHTHTSYQSHEN